LSVSVANLDADELAVVPVEWDGRVKARQWLGALVTGAFPVSHR
jgi:hypothetical protein